MKIILKQHPADKEMVEMYSDQGLKGSEMLMAVFHIDCLSRDISERLLEEDLTYGLV